MAIRPTILELGDLSAAGTRPVSELAALNSAYDDPQTDCFIWNETAVAWQQLQPGVNTASPPGGASDRWSYEVRFRESIRTQFPTGNFYIVKHAVDSTLQHTSAKPSWSPTVTGSCFSDLITKLTAAASAANGVGDSLRIDAMVISIITDDFLNGAAWMAYGKNMLSLIEAIRAAIPTIPYCTAGTISGVTPIPATVIDPHYRFSGLTDSQQFYLALCRGQLYAMEAQVAYRVGVLRTHRYVAAVDNKTFDPASMVAIGNALYGSFFYTPPVDVTSPEAPMVFVVGDSIYEGTGFNSELPAHLAGAQIGINIWQYKTGTIASLQVGVNNLISLPQAYPFHGVEIYLGESLRSSLNEIWMMKATAPGSTTANWHPYTGLYFDGFIRGWITGLVDSIRVLSKKPVMKLLSISLGTNDVIDASFFLENTVPNIEFLIKAIQRHLDLLVVDRTGMKVTVALPPETINSPTRLTFVRDALQLIEGVSLADLNGHGSLDGTHLNASGANSHAQEIFNAWNGTLANKVKPLFCLNRDSLVKALRLSQVPETNDSFSQIDSATQFVRVGFYQHLGESRVTALQAMSYAANPTTPSEQLRALATQTEIKWVRHQLLRTMPTLFMDGTSRIQAWQEEGAFRETSYLTTRDELRRLEEEIFEALGTLKNSNLDAAHRISMATVGPDSSIAPGDTVFKVI